MLSRELNEYLIRTGPDSPMGQLLRRYWIPALTSSRVAEPNGDPARVRLVGQNFVAWRDGQGRLGFFDEYCMHRGASLALGRCEGDGLRCIYHGWTFATDGTILETPNLDKASLRERRLAPAYPVREAGGIVWVYLGPPEKEPPFPHYAFMDSAAKQTVYHVTLDCNWVQLLEGNLDHSHNLLLHQDPDKLGTRYVKGPTPDPVLGDQPVMDVTGDIWSGEHVEATQFLCQDFAPEWEVEDTAFGCHGVCLHEALADGHAATYGISSTYVMPFLAIATTESFVFAAPIDDTHTSFFSLFGPIEDPDKRRQCLEWEAGPMSFYTNPSFSWDAERPAAPVGAEAVDTFTGHYRCGENEVWGQERSHLAGSFTGIEGFAPEDLAVTLAMGPILDRTKEHLVPGDLMIVRMRKRLIDTARQLEAGIEPFHLEPEQTRALGGVNKILPDPSKWREVLVPNNEPFRLVDV